MDRETWLAERRATVEATYDAEAADYDDYPAETQHEWVRRLLSSLAPDALVLDAPCGTGRYFPLVAEAGARVVGIDRSGGMLERARARGIAVRLERTTLQDLSYVEEFDAALTIDAMEHVPPEDWPGVLTNLRRAVRPDAPLYLTLEEVDDATVDRAFEIARGKGLPVVRGEVVEGDVAGYHYYPGRDRALEWLGAAGLAILDETFTRHDGWGYRHLLLRRS